MDAFLSGIFLNIFHRKKKNTKPQTGNIYRYTSLAYTVYIVIVMAAPAITQPYKKGVVTNTANLKLRYLAQLQLPVDRHVKQIRVTRYDTSSYIDIKTAQQNQSHDANGSCNAATSPH